MPPSPIRRVPSPLAVILVALLAVAGCAPAATPTPAPSPSPSPSLAATPVPSPEPSPTPTATPLPTAPAIGDPSAVALALEPVVAGLEAPVAITGAGDGSSRLFVVEQPGHIRIVRDGVLVGRPFLDLTFAVGYGGERGLLGLAFHPRYGEGDDRLFVDYTDRSGRTIVAEYRPGSDPDVADPGSARVLLRIEQPFSNHNGGALAFGPDGFLYVAMGDGGSGGDPQGNGQSRSTLLGKLLRIGVDRSEGDRPYAVPPDNPFVGVADARPEIWALGLRNPWRFSFDRATGDLWIGDVGQGAIEEVDRLLAVDGGGRGANLGWSRLEGSACYPAGTACDPASTVLPLAEYGHDQGCAVVGGVTYRGASMPALAGVHLFADYCSGRIWGVASGGPDRQEPVVLIDGGSSITSFGEDDGGEVFVTESGGRILRVVAVGGS